MSKTENKVDLNTFEFKLADRVKELKIIARDSLRMNLLSARLSIVSGLEINIEHSEKHIESINKQIEVNEYETDNLDQNHPEFKTQKELKEESLKQWKEDLKHYDKDIKDLEEQIEEEKQGMAKIEKGDTKVSSDTLSELVDKLIVEEAVTTARE